MTGAQIVLRIKQHVGNRSAPSAESNWYVDRMNEAYVWLTTYRKGGRQLRFFELMDRNDRTLTASPTDNHYTLTTGVRMVMGLYDETNNRPLQRRSYRSFMRRNLNDTGAPTVWCPIGAGTVSGYMVYPQPSSNISVVEYNYLAAETLADDSTEPVIPEEWHRVIHLAGGAFAAEQFGLPQDAQMLWQMANAFIDSHTTPVEETGDSGLRQFSVGPKYRPTGRGRA